MKRAIPALILMSCGLSSCSSLIADTGKSHAHLEKEKVNVARVRKELGEPSYRREYHPPMAIGRTPEIAKFELFEGPNLSDQVKAKVASFYEVYSRKGRFKPPSNHSAMYGMACGMTLGLSEFVFVPKAIQIKAEETKKTFHITYWYDARGQYLAFCHGDVHAYVKD